MYLWKGTSKNYSNPGDVTLDTVVLFKRKEDNVLQLQVRSGKGIITNYFSKPGDANSFDSTSNNVNLDIFEMFSIYNGTYNSADNDNNKEELLKYNKIFKRTLSKIFQHIKNENETATDFNPNIVNDLSELVQMGLMEGNMLPSIPEMIGIDSSKEAQVQTNFPKNKGYFSEKLVQSIPNRNEDYINISLDKSGTFRMVRTIPDKKAVVVYSYDMKHPIIFDFEIYDYSNALAPDKPFYSSYSSVDSETKTIINAAFNDFLRIQYGILAKKHDKIAKTIKRQNDRTKELQKALEFNKKH